MEKALITGGAGFIGSHLTHLLLSKGHPVTVVDNLCAGSMKNLSDAQSYPGFRFVNADIRNPEALQGHFEGIDWVFHLAGLTSVPSSFRNPRDYFTTNVDGTFHVLEESKKAKVKRFIYAASSSCYGKANAYPIPETAPISPQSPYASTKYLGEQLVLHAAEIYQLPALSLRLFNVFGPSYGELYSSQAVFGIFFKQKMQSKPFTIVGDGNQTRDFIYVSDVAEAFYAAARSHLTKDTLNVGTGNCHTIKQLAALFDGPIANIPKRFGDPEHSRADISKITKKLGWKAKIDFEEGVQKILARFHALVAS